MDFFIPSAIAQTAETGPPAPGIGLTQMLLYIVGFFALMYFMMIRPQNKRQKEHRELIAAVSKNDEVVLTSGMLGKVIKVDDNYMILDVGNNNELKFQKAAIHAVLPKGTIKSI